MIKLSRKDCRKEKTRKEKMNMQKKDERHFSSSFYLIRKGVTKKIELPKGLSNKGQMVRGLSNGQKKK